MIFYVFKTTNDRALIFYKIERPKTRKKGNKFSWLDDMTSCYNFDIWKFTN